MALLEGPVHLIQEESTISMATQLHILVDVSYTLLMNYCLSTYVCKRNTVNNFYSFRSISGSLLAVVLIIIITVMLLIYIWILK